jgi:phage gp36-like protein
MPSKRTCRPSSGIPSSRSCDRTNGTVDRRHGPHAALTRADSEINSYVAQRYTLPFAATPTRLRDRGDGHRALLPLRRARPQIVQDRYNNAVAWLKDVASGRAPWASTRLSNLIPKRLRLRDVRPGI